MDEFASFRPKELSFPMSRCATVKSKEKQFDPERVRIIPALSERYIFFANPSAISRNRPSVESGGVGPNIAAARFIQRVGWKAVILKTETVLKQRGSPQILGVKPKVEVDSEYPFADMLGSFSREPKSKFAVNHRRRQGRRDEFEVTPNPLDD